MEMTNVGMSVGIPELIIILIMVVTWVVPVAVAMWMVVTLRRLRAGQQAVEMKLETIERLLQRS
jgi:hypothetical protein